MERVLNLLMNAASTQPPFLPFSVINILFTASFKNAQKSLLDIGPEAPRPNLLVSSAIYPTNESTTW